MREMDDEEEVYGMGDDGTKLCAPPCGVAEMRLSPREQSEQRVICLLWERHVTGSHIFLLLPFLSFSLSLSPSLPPSYPSSLPTPAAICKLSYDKLQKSLVLNFCLCCTNLLSRILSNLFSGQNIAMPNANIPRSNAHPYSVRCGGEREGWRKAKRVDCVATCKQYAPLPRCITSTIA